MATPLRSFGTLLARETTPASSTFTDIGGVTDLNYPTLDVAVADTTAMETASAFRTNTPTLGTLGPMSFTLHYDSADATQEQLTADCVAQTIRLYRIVGTDTGAADWRFNAHVTTFNVTATIDGVSQAAVTLTPTGVVTRA